jgi:hypothetical protein
MRLLNKKARPEGLASIPATKEVEKLLEFGSCGGRLFRLWRRAKNIGAQQVPTDTRHLFDRYSHVGGSSFVAVNPNRNVIRRFLYQFSQFFLIACNNDLSIGLS